MHTGLRGVCWRLGPALGLAALTLGVGLGSSSRLTYHEAIVGQSAREMIATGDLVAPTIGGRPWLEKPPLAIWLVAASGRLAGGIGEASARLPSAVSAALLVVGVTLLASRRFGPGIGRLAGLVQATTLWLVVRGRLAEADIHLAALLTWTVVAFDRIRTRGGEGADEPAQQGNLARGRWGVFAGLGLMSLTKGVGFGPALAVAALGPLLLWDRDRGALRALRSKWGWGLVAALTLAWPLAVLVRHPTALSLWTRHVVDRLAERPEHFIGQSTPSYVAELAVQLLPWLPLTLWGAARSLPRALGPVGRGGGDRLLWAWAAGPLALLALPTVKNAHYAIHALPPCAIWAALGVARLGERLQSRRGWPPARVRRLALGTFAGLGLAYAAGFAGLGPTLDRRGVEWAFYEDAGRLLRPGEPLTLLYRVPDWDRKPYDTPFGPVPHDYAVRLFYLNHPATPQYVPSAGPQAPAPAGPGASSTFAAIGREVDGAALARFGHVEALARGPATRSDRAYVLYRVTPTPAVAASPDAPLRR